MHRKLHYDYNAHPRLHGEGGHGGFERQIMLPLGWPGKVEWNKWGKFKKERKKAEYHFQFWWKLATNPRAPYCTCMNAVLLSYSSWQWVCILCDCHSKWHGIHPQQFNKIGYSLHTFKSQHNQQRNQKKKGRWIALLICGGTDLRRSAGVKLGPFFFKKKDENILLVVHRKKKKNLHFKKLVLQKFEIPPPGGGR